MYYSMDFRILDHGNYEGRPFFFPPKEYSIFFCSTSINVTIRKNLSEIILLPKFTPSCGESWKALVNGHHQVDNKGYTFPKQSSFMELTAQ